MLNKSSSNNGQIQIIVIGSIFLLTIFVFSMAHRLSIEYRISDYRQDELRAYFLARAGVEYVFSEIENDTTDVNSINESWGNHPELYKKIPLGDGFFEVVNNRGENFFGAIDEESKININTASKDVLTAFFSKEMAEAVVEWREGKTFNLKEEITFVPGISKEIYAKIKDFITVYGKGRININTADKEVLSSLGLGQSLAEKIVDYREGLDRVLGTEDDRIFDNVETIGQRLSDYVVLTSDERKKLETVKSMITVGSNNFSFISYGWFEKDKIKKSIEIVATRAKDGIKIQYWYEE